MRQVLLQRNSWWYMLMSLILAVSFFVATAGHAFATPAAHWHVSDYEYSVAATQSSLPVCPSGSAQLLQHLWFAPSSACASEYTSLSVTFASAALLVLLVALLYLARMRAYSRMFQNTQQRFLFGTQWAHWFALLEKRDPLFV